MRKVFYKNYSPSNLYRVLIIIILILVASVIFRIPFLGEPLDRDSGLFVYLGYMHGEGSLLYKDLPSSRPPGIAFLFSLVFRFFQPTDITVSIFVMCWAILNALLIYLLAVVLVNDFLFSCLAVFLYGFLSSSPFLNGEGAMTESFMVTFNMLGFYFLLKAKSKPRLPLFLIAGFSFGISILFKQVGVFDYAAAIVYLLILVWFGHDKITSFLKKSTVFTFAFVFPFLATISYYAYKGAFKEFIFWIFEFNFKYAKLLGYDTANYWQKFWYFNSNIFRVNSLIWIGSAIFILLLGRDIFLRVILKKGTLNQMSSKIILLFCWGMFSFTGVCSSGRFFPHYYLTILPSFILMTVFALRRLWLVFNSKYIRIFIVAFSVLSIGWSVYLNYDYYLKLTPEQISMREYAWEPFVEARQAGFYVRDRTKPTDYIYVWAEEQEIYFYCLRKPPGTIMDSDPFVFFPTVFKNAENDLISSLMEKRPVYLIIDTRYFKALTHYKKIYDFVENNYAVEKEFKVIRNNSWGYSLLVLRLKQ